MHRYQAEATVKLIGGMDYNYAKKGDGQLIVEDLDSSIQQNALLSLLASISAQNLTIPRKILKLLPPRAYGYPKTRESFGGKTGVSFDPFSAASTATELVINLLLNPKRLNRIVIQNSLDQSKLSIDKVFDEINNYVGKPYTIFQRLRIGGIGSSKLIINKADSKISNLLNLDNNINKCNIEIRPKGIIIRFRSLLETYGLIIPFFKLKLCPHSIAVVGLTELISITIDPDFKLFTNLESLITDFTALSTSGSA